MKKGLFIVMLLALSLGLVLEGYGQDEPDFKILTAEVITIHPGFPYTMTVKTRGEWEGQQEIEETFTIDPNCTFYKDDERPKTIEIVKPGDEIEITYVVSEGIKVAFNIVVMPESETVKEEVSP